MSSTPQDGSSASQPSAPTVEDETTEEAESEDLEAQLDMVATRSPI
jgi:hypothetical protein